MKIFFDLFHFSRFLPAEALSSTPNDVNCLLNCALTYYHFLVTEKMMQQEMEEREGKEGEGDTKTDVVLSAKDLLSIKTDELFNRVIRLDKVRRGVYKRLRNWLND